MQIKNIMVEINQNKDKDTILFLTLSAPITIGFAR